LQLPHPTAARRDLRIPPFFLTWAWALGKLAFVNSGPRRIKISSLDAKRESLAGVALFANLDENGLTQLAQVADEKTFARDSVILQQEAPGNALFVIVQGRVKVVLYGEDGREVILSTLHDGEFFGEMSLLDGKPRSASVVAVEPTVLLRLRRDAFQALLRKNPDIALKILEALSLRLRSADSRIGSLALLDVYGRVARALRELVQREGKAAGSNVILERRPTHQDLAAMAGTSRETVSRVLGDFVRSGLVTLDGRRMILHDEFLDSTEGAP